MTRRMPRARSGITLTEILISILILGVGMVSLATLFPIGLLRLRDAQRNSRSTLLYYSAGNDLQARDCFNFASFPSSWYGPTIPGTGGTASAFVAAGYNAQGYDPWAHDPLISGGADVGVTRTIGRGLPVMYDPLWWSVILPQVAGQASNGTLASTTGPLPASPAGRFGAATTALHTDSGTGNAASAAGLQRLTNFITLGDPSLFVSQDDLVTMASGPSSQNTPPTATTPGSYDFGSPVLPVLTYANSSSIPRTQNDWSYSWAFTGQRIHVNEFTAYVGSIVVFNNRPFAVGTGGVPAGERVVEGIFGYGRGNAVGVSTGDPRLVLLRWPSSQPDPDVAVGSWLADVTYEQNGTTATSKFTSNPGIGSLQRCHWYRVAKRSVPVPDPDATNYGGYRRMTVTLAAPVVERTLLTAGSDVPVITNAALLCPSVVNVIPKVVYSR